MKNENILSALNQLSPKQKRVVLYRVRDHLRFREIGEKMGISTSSAYQIWSRAKCNLLEEMLQEEQR